MTYIVKWEMAYDDARDAYEAMAMAFGNLAEVISNPSEGTNFFSIIKDGEERGACVEMHEALHQYELMTAMRRAKGED